ncbi:MAG: hypothetical protein NVSMB57_01230 [Actinomycetota bacterium]
MLLGAIVASASANPTPAVANKRVRAAHQYLTLSMRGDLPAHPKAAAPVPIAGKGMWIWQFNKIANGNPEKVAYYAKQGDLTHIFVRVGSGVAGLNTLEQVSHVLPYAHRLGVKVIAWYFPYYNDIAADVRNSVAAISYRYQGEAFDGFAADIEPAPGAALNARTVSEYSSSLRKAAPDTYLISVPPRPTQTMIRTFPYAEMMPWYDAVAPMVYWGRFSPDTTTEAAIAYLSRWGKPVAPIGQMYDMRTEGGPAGNPPNQETWAFMRTSKQRKAIGISFWSWQEATSREWRVLRAFPW